MAKGKKTTPKQRRKRKLILFIVEILILLILLAGLYVTSKFNLMERTVLDKEQTQNQELDIETQETLESYTDVALFGLDNRSSGNFANGNSDVIMVVSINNKTKELSMMSVYRDTYLDISGKDQEARFRKANAAYANGGAERAIRMLNNSLDLDIDEYVSFDFESVADAIDVLGGIEIELTSAEVTQLNKNLEVTAQVVGGKANYVSGAGVKTLDGIQAVSYARIRATAGGDFKRAERQRIVIAATLDKAKSCDLKTLSELVDVVFPEIETSMSAGTMLQMAVSLMGYDISQSYGFPFERTTMTHGSKGSIVVPCTLESNVKEVHRLLYGKEDYVPSEQVKRYSQYIINDTGKTEKSAMDDQFTLDAQE